MTICADYLHMPHGEFKRLPRDEQTKWRLFIPDRWRREEQMREAEKTKHPRKT